MEVIARLKQELPDHLTVANSLPYAGKLVLLLLRKQS